MRPVQALTIMFAAAVIAISVASCLHVAHAKGHDDGGLHIRPRGTGGPPVVVPDDPVNVPAAWQIKIALYNRGPQGGLFTYGTEQTGAVEFATQAECEAAIKQDPVLNDSLKKLKAATAQTGHVLKPFCVHFSGGERVD